MLNAVNAMNTKNAKNATNAINSTCPVIINHDKQAVDTEG
jgi:hypothetical protein